MSPLEPTLGSWTLAAGPILVVLVLMVGLRWGGAKAGPAGWLAALLLAWLVFGANGELLGYAQLRALFLALYVLYIIWAALLLYHVVNEAGAIEAIGAELSKLTTDQGMLALLLGWTFGSFLQGASGFGVPAAVVAPLLVGLGISAGRAVVIALVGHAWAVTFGSLASSFLALMAATGRPGPELAPWSALLLGIAGFGCGAAVLWAVGGARGWLRRAGVWLVLGLVMGGVQLALALLGFYTIASFLAGLAGLGVMVMVLRRNRLTPAAGMGERGRKAGIGAGAWALIPYGLLVAIVVLGETVLAEVLDFAVIRPSFPEVRTSLGWVTPAGPGRSINLFGHGGALLLYTILITFLIYRAQGRYNAGAGRRIVRNTLRGAVKSSIGILTMVGMAVMMENTGMTRLLAEGISQGVGSAFPVAAPLIGALGAFMTGSNTNSNVVFAAMQEQTAVILGLNPLIILAAQTAGGAIGALFAPAKVIVGCSTVNLGGREGEVLRDAILYGMAILALICLVTWAAVQLWI
jgi:lactate permease